MGDAVRRVQKHLQELSRDHLTSVEDRHHANLGWLQIELQQLCKQIEVEVRVELTRPPRLSFSKPPTALLPPTSETNKSTHVTTSTRTVSSSTANEQHTAAAPSEVATAKPKTPVLPSPVQMAPTRLVFDDHEQSSSRGSSKQQLDEIKKQHEDVTSNAKKSSASNREVIEVDAESDVEMIAVVPASTKRMVKRTVKRTRKVLKPKKVMKTEKIFVKDEKPSLPQVDVSALKVTDLKFELKKRGLKQTGVKAVLAVRLKEALDAEDAAQAEDAGKWITKEVVEDILEEVEEEYEEDIEEEADQVSPPADDLGNGVTVIGNNKHGKKVVVSGDAIALKEAECMSLEDTDVKNLGADTTTKQPGVSESTVPATEASPKSSLSDVVASLAVDEIVRESADGFISPEGKTLTSKLTSSTKPRGENAQFASVVSEAKSMETMATTVSDSPTPLAATKCVAQTNPEVSPSPSLAGLAKKSDQITKVVEEIVPGQAVQQTQRLSAATQAGQPQQKEQTELGGKAVNVSTSKSVVSVGTEKTFAHQAVSVTTNTARPHDEQKMPAANDTATPSRDLMERVKSLASSSRSSSISSLSAARRYNGSMSFVEDSQPEQSPLRSISATDFSAHSTRAVSTSQLEIELPNSRAKTPDSGSIVPPPNERVAQSEPRAPAAKVEVEDEAQRKRREQQENIQREAQRLRMAMKQSAKKRFEESKTTTLFWKRDQEKPDGLPEVVTPSESASIESNTSPASSAPASTASTASEVSEPKKRRSADPIVTKDAVGDGTEPDPPISSAAGSLKTTVVTQSLPSASQILPTAKVSKVEPEKRPLPSRKRSSIVLDTSKSTLYPSKKRISVSRAKEVETTAKRTSLTKTSSPADNSRKQTSTERLPTKIEASKRKRSSEPRELSSAPKRKSVSSNQSDVQSNRFQTASGSTRAPKTTSKLVAPTTKRRDSASSTISSSSSVSVTDNRAKPASNLGGGAVRKPANLVSGLHSFTSLLEKDSANLSSSQGSSASNSSRQTVSALKLAEKSRLLEQKKNLEKAKRKEALARRYEEQRKADEEKRKKYALMKEKAERDARLKREQEQAAEKKQRELELAKKRQQRLQELRSGLEKKKVQVVDKDQTTVSKTTVPVSRIAGAASSTHSTKPLGKTTLTGSKEVTTYAMSENEESSDSEDEKDTERNSKNIPKWAQRENLERTLRIQFGPNAIDPTPTIFPDFVDSCDLEAIFEPTDVRKKKRFQRRTSSGNWLGDRPTAREKAVYKKDMGFSR